MDLFSFLKSLISYERKSGRVLRKPYCRDASIALDIYMSAQEDKSNMDRCSTATAPRAETSGQMLARPIQSISPLGSYIL